MASASDNPLYSSERNSEGSQRNSGPNVNVMDLFKGAQLTKDNYTDTSKGCLPDFHIFDSSTMGSPQVKLDSSRPLAGSEIGGSGKTLPGDNSGTGTIAGQGGGWNPALEIGGSGKTLPGDNIGTGNIDPPAGWNPAVQIDGSGKTLPGDNIGTGNINRQGGRWNPSLTESMSNTAHDGTSTVAADNGQLDLPNPPQSAAQSVADYSSLMVDGASNSLANDVKSPADSTSTPAAYRRTTAADLVKSMNESSDPAMQDALKTAREHGFTDKEIADIASGGPYINESQGGQTMFKATMEGVKGGDTEAENAAKSFADQDLWQQMHAAGKIPIDMMSPAQYDKYASEPGSESLPYADFLKTDDGKVYQKALNEGTPYKIAGLMFMDEYMKAHNQNQ